VFKIYGGALLALLSAGCGAPESRQSAPHNSASQQAIAAAPYRIDSMQSELRILVYRAGPMAMLGHNHVIANRSLGGWVRYAGKAADASFALTVPNAGFVVDDDAMRREEGAEFAEETPQDAKSGTLHNMQSAALLDAAQFPEITVRSVAIAGPPDGLTATVEVSVAGHESRIDVPFTLEASPGRLAAHGEVWVRQSALGLTPFSVMMGALRVRDDIRVKFRFAAATR